MLLGRNNLEERKKDAKRNVDCKCFVSSSFRYDVAVVVVVVLTNFEVSKESRIEIHSERKSRSNPIVVVVSSSSEESVEPNDPVVAAVVDVESKEEEEVETFLKGDEADLQRDFDNPMDLLPSFVAVAGGLDDYFLCLALGR